MYFKIYKESVGVFRFEFETVHGSFLFKGIGAFRSVDHCMKGITYFKSQSMYDSFFSRETDSGDNPYFLLVDQAGKRLGIRDIYSSFTLMEQDINDLKNQIYAAPVEVILE